MKKWERREWWEEHRWTSDDIDQMWQEEKARLEQQPWYEAGKPCKTDIFFQRDRREEMERTWGRWGAEGIGRLRKVAVFRPHEYEVNPVFEKEPAYYRLYKNKLPDLEKWHASFNDYVKILEGEGVEVLYLEPPDSPIGPYGFYRFFATPGGMTATKAGMIIQRAGRTGAAVDFGLGKWLAQETLRLGCPIYHSMLAPSEITPIYIAENSVVIAEGYPTPAEGAQEMKTLLEAVGDEVWVANTTGYLDYWGFPAGGTSHLDMVLATVDLGLVMVYPSLLDWRTITYLRSKKIRFVEVPPDEWTEYANNIIEIEPGKIVIPAAAKETIRKLRKEGVTCIEADFEENSKSGLGGPDCLTMKLLRDPGPSLSDL